MHDARGQGASLPAPITVRYVDPGASARALPSFGVAGRSVARPALHTQIRSFHSTMPGAAALPGPSAMERAGICAEDNKYWQR